MKVGARAPGVLDVDALHGGRHAEAVICLLKVGNRLLDGGVLAHIFVDDVGNGGGKSYCVHDSALLLAREVRVLEVVTEGQRVCAVVLCRVMVEDIGVRPILHDQLIGRINRAPRCKAGVNG
jgi:hypothetical protein